MTSFRQTVRDDYKSIIMMPYLPAYLLVWLLNCFVGGSGEYLFLFWASLIWLIPVRATCWVNDDLFHHRESLPRFCAHFAVASALLFVLLLSFVLSALCFNSGDIFSFSFLMWLIVMILCSMGMTAFLFFVARLSTLLQVPAVLLMSVFCFVLPLATLSKSGVLDYAVFADLCFLAVAIPSLLLMSASPAAQPKYLLEASLLSLLSFYGISAGVAALSGLTLSEDFVCWGSMKLFCGLTVLVYLPQLLPAHERIKWGVASDKVPLLSSLFFLLLSALGACFLLWGDGDMLRIMTLLGGEALAFLYSWACFLLVWRFYYSSSAYKWLLTLFLLLLTFFCFSSWALSGDLYCYTPFFCIISACRGTLLPSQLYLFVIAIPLCFYLSKKA